MGDSQIINDNRDETTEQEPVETVSTEDLIEEVSIDGMCGVY